jgi:hypothetical protein
MQSNVPLLLTLDQIEPGDFFIFVDRYSNGYALCLKAQYTRPEVDKLDAGRVVPIHWPAKQCAVGTPLDQVALNGWGIVPEEAWIEADLTSITSETHANGSEIFQTRTGLFMLLKNGLQTFGYVNFFTGVISTTLESSAVCYSKWSIAISDRGRARRIIFEFPDHALQSE